MRVGEAEANEIGVGVLLLGRCDDELRELGPRRVVAMMVPDRGLDPRGDVDVDVVAHGLERELHVVRLPVLEKLLEESHCCSLGSVSSGMEGNCRILYQKCGEWSIGGHLKKSMVFCIVG